MRSFTLVAVLIPLLLAIGCKRPKPTEPANPDLAKVKISPEPPTPKNDKVKKDDEPNWIKGPLGGKKDEPTTLPVDGPANPGKQPWNVGPPKGGFAAPMPVPGMPPVVPGPGAPGAGEPKPPGMGVVPPIAPAGNTPLGAAARLVALADMRDLQIFIHDASLVTGKMPSGAAIFAALVEARSPAAPLVKDGAIILTGTTERESVWAFEARAYLNGGMVVTQNGVEKLTAAELKERLGK